MEYICGSGRPHVEPDQLKEKHNEWRAIALIQLQQIGNMQEFKTKLGTEIDSLFDEYVKRNEKKRLTPLDKVKRGFAIVGAFAAGVVAAPFAAIAAPFVAAAAANEAMADNHNTGN